VESDLLLVEDELLELCPERTHALLHVFVVVLAVHLSNKDHALGGLEQLFEAWYLGLDGGGGEVTFATTAAVLRDCPVRELLHDELVLVGGELVNHRPLVLLNE